MVRTLTLVLLIAFLVTLSTLPMTSNAQIRTVTAEAINIDAEIYDYLITDSGTYLLYRNESGIYVLTPDGILYWFNLDEGALTLVNGDVILVGINGTNITLFDLTSMTQIASYLVPFNDLFLVYYYEDIISVIVRNATTTDPLFHSLVINVSSNTAMYYNTSITYGYGAYLIANGSTVDVFSADGTYRFSLTIDYPNILTVEFYFAYPVNTTTIDAYVYYVSDNQILEKFVGIIRYNIYTSVTQKYHIPSLYYYDVKIYKSGGDRLISLLYRDFFSLSVRLDGTDVFHTRGFTVSDSIPPYLPVSFLEPAVVFDGNNFFAFLQKTTYKISDVGIYLTDTASLQITPFQSHMFTPSDIILTKLSTPKTFVNGKTALGSPFNIVYRPVSRLVTTTLYEITGIYSLRYIFTDVSAEDVEITTNDYIVTAEYNSSGAYALVRVINSSTTTHIDPTLEHIYCVYIHLNDKYFFINYEVFFVYSDATLGVNIVSTAQLASVEILDNKIVLTSTNSDKRYPVSGYFIVGVPVPEGKKVVDVLADGQPAPYVIENGYVTADPSSTIVILLADVGNSLGGEASWNGWPHVVLVATYVTVVVAIVKKIMRK